MLTIHECSPGPVKISQKLKAECPSYVSSQFDPSLPLGAIHAHDGWRNENLEAQTFPDESFDVVITQDVFEHVFRPDLAIKEIARTLRPGGVHIATVPLVRKTAQSRRRARLQANGSVEHLETPEYHSNPIDPAGSLVTIDWGFDIGLYFHKHGLSSLIIAIDNLEFGIRADLIEVLVCLKQTAPEL